MRRIRGLAIVAVAIAAALTGGCGGPSRGSPLPDFGGDTKGWRRVGVPGTVRSIPPGHDLLVAGDQRGRTVLAVVRDGRYSSLEAGTGPRNGVDAIDTDGRAVVLTEHSDVAEGEPAAMWSADFHHVAGHIRSEWTREVLADQQNRKASWLRPL